MSAIDTLHRNWLLSLVFSPCGRDMREQAVKILSNSLLESFWRFWRRGWRLMGAVALVDRPIEVG